MYRPTVRYDEVFRDYVDSLFHATTLDRNQVIRLALFTAGHSKEFYDVLSKYKRAADVPTLPSAKWRPDQSRLWLDQTYLERGEKGDVNAIVRGKEVNNEVIVRGADGGKASDRRVATAERRIGPVPSERIDLKNSGGLVFKID
jgi:hypothetical protein